MHSYSVRKLVPSTVLSFRIVTKCRVTVYVLNIFVENLSPAFRKIIRLEKPCMNVFPDFSQVQDPQWIITAAAMLLLLSRIGVALDNGRTENRRGVTHAWLPEKTFQNYDATIITGHRVGLNENKVRLVDDRGQPSDKGNAIFSG